jgi:hypothetical protein
LLVKTLAERYPHDAPVRQSTLRTPTPVPVHQAQTMMAGGAGRASLPSMGEQRSAPTGTMQPAAGVTPTGAAQVMTTMPGSRSARRSRAVVFAVIGFVIAAGGAFGIVSAVTSGARTGSGPGSGSGSGSGSGLVVAAAPVMDAALPPDAAPQVASVTKPTPPDAGVADAPSIVATPAKKDASSSQPAHPAARGAGTLDVVAFPVLAVYVDRKLFGSTPQTVPLPAGKHTVRLVNSDLGHDETLTVTVTANQKLTLDRQNWK